MKRDGEFRKREVEEACAEIVSLFLECYEKWLEIKEIRNLDGEKLVEELTTIVTNQLRELKERCDLLFRYERTRKEDVSPAEVVFDYLVGAIYHHFLKLREVAFQLNSRIPPVEGGCDVVEDALMATWRRLVERARLELEEGFEMAEEFWKESIDFLQRLLYCYRDNPQVVRAVLARRSTLVRAFPNKSLREMLDQIYENCGERAFIIVSDELTRSGWLEEATNTLEEGLSLYPSNEELSSRIKTLKQARF